MQRRSARVSALADYAVHEDGGPELRARDDEEKTTETQPDIQTDERARRSSATFTSFASSGACVNLLSAVTRFTSLPGCRSFGQDERRSRRTAVRIRL